MEKKNFRRKYTKSIFRELFAPIIRDAVDKAMAKYQSTPVVTQPAVKEIFNVDEADSFLGLSKSRVYKMTHNREVPYFSTGKRVYFKREDLLDFADMGELVGIDRRGIPVRLVMLIFRKEGRLTLADCISQLTQLKPPRSA